MKRLAMFVMFFAIGGFVLGCGKADTKKKTPDKPKVEDTEKEKGKDAPAKTETDPEKEETPEKKTE